MDITVYTIFSFKLCFDQLAGVEQKKQKKLIISAAGDR